VSCAYMRDYSEIEVGSWRGWHVGVKDVQDTADGGFVRQSLKGSN